jgi:hypothetical protein
MPKSAIFGCSPAPEKDMMTVSFAQIAFIQSSAFSMVGAA